MAGGRAQRDQDGIAPDVLLQLLGVTTGVGRRVHGRGDQRQPGRQLRGGRAEVALVGVVVVGRPPRRVELGGDQQVVGVVAVGVGEHGQPPVAGGGELLHPPLVNAGPLGPRHQAPVDLRAEVVVDADGLGHVQRRVGAVAPLPLAAGPRGEAEAAVAAGRARPAGDAVLVPVALLEARPVRPQRRAQAQRVRPQPRGPGRHRRRGGIECGEVEHVASLPKLGGQERGAAMSTSSRIPIASGTSTATE